MTDHGRLLEIIDRFERARVLVVGDVILDRFIWGKVSRISPEAPVPVVHVTRESSHLGGAANVVSNIQALGGRAVPLGLIGEDKTADEFLALLEAEGIDPGGMVRDGDFQTIQKTRIIAHHQQVCRVDREGEPELSERAHAAVADRVALLMKSSDALIVSDYGKGVITPALLKGMIDHADRKHISVDPKDVNFGNYKGVDILTPNHNEAERMSGVRFNDMDGCRKAAGVIFERLGCKDLLITLGEQGMALFRGPEDMILIPTRAREVFDVSGAGDTVIATYTLAVAVGASAHDAAVLANAAAGVVVGKLGTATLTAEELRAGL